MLRFVTLDPFFLCFFIIFFFHSRDIKRVKDTKKYFDKITEELDTALNKNAQIIKAKPQEAEESRKLVLATRSAFGVTAFDYSLQVNVSRRFKIILFKTD